MEMIIGFLEWCRQCGRVPSEWRCASWTPLYRAGDPTLYKRHRPIALMPTLAKVFEALLLPRLRARIDPQLCRVQFGFRYGADEAVFSLQAVIQERQRRGLSTFLGFLDITKAYDTVWREGLFMKLRQCGIQGHTWLLLLNLYHGSASGLCGPVAN